MIGEDYGRNHIKHRLACRLCWRYCRLFYRLAMVLADPFRQKKWAEGSGVELGDASSMPMGAMAAQALGLIVVAWFVAIMAAQNLLLTTLLSVVGFTLLQYAGNSFSGKSSYAKLVDASYWLVSVIIMIAVQLVL